MRSRPADDRVTELTRRRLAALAAELAAARGEVPADALPLAEPAVEPPDGGTQAGQPAGVAQARTSGTGRHARKPPGVLPRAARWAGDRLPPALADRPHLGSAQAGLVLAIVAAGLVLSAWWLLRADGSGGGVAAPVRRGAAVAVSPSGGATPPAASPTAGQPSAVSPTTFGSGSGSQASPAAGGDQIVVDVAGKVRHPGIAVLPAGARVVDAVRAAGGVRPGVD